jgi:hypothetical protein
MTPDIGPRPELRWLPIAALIVDRRYQREISTKRGRRAIEKMAAYFHWRRFTPVVVSPRDDGRFAVLDGQHKIEAARRRHLAEVPCYIVETAGLEEEADSFLSINGDRVAITAQQMFHAALAAGQAEASAVLRICTSAGVEIPRYPIPRTSMKPNQTLAIGTIRLAFREHGAEPVVDALAILRAAFPEDAGELSARAIRALIVLLTEPGKQLDRRQLILAVASRLDDERGLEARYLARAQTIRPPEAYVEILRRDYMAERRPPVAAAVAPAPAAKPAPPVAASTLPSTHRRAPATHRPASRPEPNLTSIFVSPGKGAIATARDVTAELMGDPPPGRGGGRR